LIQCDLCNARVLMTADCRHSKFCDDCLAQYISESIEGAIEAEADDHIPPWQVHG
jgi:hypothetical protein